MEWPASVKLGAISAKGTKRKPVRKDPCAADSTAHARTPHRRGREYRYRSGAAPNAPTFAAHVILNSVDRGKQFKRLQAGLPSAQALAKKSCSTYPQGFVR